MGRQEGVGVGVSHRLTPKPCLRLLRWNNYAIHFYGNSINFP